MSRQFWDFTLLDTGFFRSGQPFNAGEAGHSRVISLFPPPMSTLQGAIRTALAAERGWHPGQHWPEELGDAGSLGLLSLKGPYLIMDGIPLFPAPLNLLVKSNPGKDNEKNPDIETTFLVPGEKYSCDLGPAVSLPQKKTELDKAYPAKDLYLTRKGFSAVAEGKNLPEKEFYFQDKLWCIEPRIGLKRSAETRTAENHNLYRIGHIRPKEGLKIRVIVEGLPADWSVPEQQIVPLGGEGRLSSIEVGALADEGFFPDFPNLSARDGNIHYTITLITPACGNKKELEKLILQGPDNSNAPGYCISACVDRPLLFGGWDLVNREPRPLQPYLPPGSTWFFKAETTEWESIKALHGNFIRGENKPPYGYGQILIGTWEVD